METIAFTFLLERCYIRFFLFGWGKNCNRKKKTIFFLISFGLLKVCVLELCFFVHCNIYGVKKTEIPFFYARYFLSTLKRGFMVLLPINKKVFLSGTKIRQLFPCIKK